MTSNDYYQRRFTTRELNQIRNNLYTFYRWFVISKFEENITAPHIKKLAYKLMDLSNGKLGKSRICIAMPPQHSKSSLATIAYSCWLLLRNPSLRILIVNSEGGLSQHFGGEIRNLLYNVAPFFKLRVSDEQATKTYIKLTKDGKATNGYIQLTGSEGKITGRAVDVMIIDDPYKGLEEEFTPTQIYKKWDWFTSLIEQRLRTEDRSKLIILHTRWHSEDIQGKIKADEYQAAKYEFVEYKAIDENNQPLWPEYYSMDFYRDKERTMKERRFQAIYQQTPLDLTSDYFHLENLHWDENYIEQYNIANCRSYDMAYTSQQEALDNNLDADFTGGLYAEKISDDHYIFSDFLYKRLGKENIQYIQRNAKFDGTSKPILIEPGTKGGAAKELFRLWDEDYLTDYKCIQSEPIGTKADRATALANAIFDGKIHIYCPDQAMRKILKTQLESFPHGSAHKDLIDAMAYAYNYLKDKKDADKIYNTSKKKHGRKRRTR